MIKIGNLILLGLLLGIGSRTRAQDDANSGTNTPDMDAAWGKVYRATQEPFPPEEWQTNQPTHAEVVRFYAPLLTKGADMARDFYTRFPDSPRAVTAHAKEYSLIRILALGYGDTNQFTRLRTLQAARLKDHSLTSEERYKIMNDQAEMLIPGLPGTRDELENVARAWQKDYPERAEPYQLLFIVAQTSEDDKADDLLKVIVNSPAPDEIKQQAQGLLKNRQALGKPVSLKFKAVDGRMVDLDDLKGKVVLIDFWATWCGPCVGEVPHVKEAYDKLHGQGFEIVGISLDQDQGALEKFVAKQKMAWPQFFDGGGFDNKFAKQFGIEQIPTMWLVDKKGVLRDLDARWNLEDEITKLLDDKAGP